MLNEDVSFTASRRCGQHAGRGELRPLQQQSKRRVSRKRAPSNTSERAPDASMCRVSLCTSNACKQEVPVGAPVDGSQHSPRPLFHFALDSKSGDDSVQRLQVAAMPSQVQAGTPLTARVHRNSAVETCAICCEVAPPQTAAKFGCGHGWYCLRCIRLHAETKLGLGSVQIPCPECCAAVAERDLKLVLTPEFMDRLLTRSLEQAVAATQNLFACPTPDCTMRVAIEDEQSSFLKCTLCKKASCVRCGAQPYHYKITCEQHADRVRMNDEAGIRKWMEDTGAKQCPTCRTGVTKHNLSNQNTQRSECHKMMCQNCGTRFCFRCLALLTNGYSCGCTSNIHGFIDPRTGKRVAHATGKRKRRMVATPMAVSQGFSAPPTAPMGTSA